MNWARNIALVVGMALVMWGIQGLANTVKRLRAEVQMQSDIIELYRSHADATVVARSEKRLEHNRYNSDIAFLSESVWLNLGCLLVGFWLMEFWQRRRRVGIAVETEK